MFERYTQESRRIVVVSQEIARDAGVTWIGTEHLMAAMFDKDTTARRALTSLGLSRPEFEGDEPPRSGHLLFTPQAKRVFDMATRDASQLGSTPVETEHLLIALIRSACEEQSQ